jgi:hypothetical protein
LKERVGSSIVYNPENSQKGKRKRNTDTNLKRQIELLREVYRGYGDKLVD